MLYVSEPWSSLIGTTAAEVVGRSAAEFYAHPKDRIRFVKEMNAHGKVDSFEAEMLRADGSTFWVSLTSRYFEFEGREAVITGLFDLTERKAMEAELRESEARFRSIAGAHPVAVSIGQFQEGGKLLYVSQPWADLMQYSVDASVGMPASDIYGDPQDRLKILELVKESGAVYAYELQLKRRDGSLFHGAVTSKRMQFAGEDVIVTGVVDLTEEKAAQQEINRQREALHQSEKLSALGSLLAGVAHELNNPLSVVIGQSMMMEEDTAGTRTADRAATIRNAAERCGRIVRTFLDMARKREPNRKAIDINEVVDGAVDLFRLGLGDTGISLARQSARNLPPVLADADQINQVVANLCLNAQQALEDAGQAGTITVSTGTDYDDVVISVADDGPGIPEGQRERVFEPFFTSKDMGTGLGLSVCHGFIVAHGGGIALSETPGGGATFRVRLPGDPAGRETATAGGTATEHGMPSGKSVLVIDDERDVRQMLKEILERTGLEVTLAENGRDAVDALIDGDKFDLIISDLRMPEMDGQAFYEWLSRVRPELIERLVYLTGDTLSDSAREFVESITRPVIEKPITPEDVRTLVRRELTDPSS
jgi:PAS domain S-box-containing protein